MSDSEKPKEIESLNQEDFDVEGLSPEDLEKVAGGLAGDCGCFGTNCSCNSTYAPSGEEVAS